LQVIAELTQTQSTRNLIRNFKTDFYADFFTQKRNKNTTDFEQVYGMKTVADFHSNGIKD